MFVKIIDPKGTEGVHECRGFNLARSSNGAVLVLLPSGDRIEINADSSVYLMNDEGRTIDSYIGRNRRKHGRDV